MEEFIPIIIFIIIFVVMTLVQQRKQRARLRPSRTFASGHGVGGADIWHRGDDGRRGLQYDDDLRPEKDVFPAASTAEAASRQDGVTTDGRGRDKPNASRSALAGLRSGDVAFKREAFVLKEVLGPPRAFSRPGAVPQRRRGE